MDNLTTAQYKSYANDIVGTWYNDMPDEVMIFSFLYNYTQESDLLIIKGDSRQETTYSIQVELNGVWCLTIRNKKINRTIYYIKLLSPDLLVLIGSNRKQKVFSRKIDDAFVLSTLEKIK